MSAAVSLDEVAMREESIAEARRLARVPLVVSMTSGFVWVDGERASVDVWSHPVPGSASHEYAARVTLIDRRARRVFDAYVSQSSLDARALDRAGVVEAARAACEAKVRRAREPRP